MYEKTWEGTDDGIGKEFMAETENTDWEGTGKGIGRNQGGNLP